MIKFHVWLLFLNICYATGDPLLLTKFIKRGKIDEGQNAAKVTHPLFLGIDSYSGYFTVNEFYKSHIFFWYIPTEHDQNAPLLLWFSGGLGQSSLVDLFLQIGPYVPSSPEYLSLRDHSLHKHVNLLIMDAPVGVGFSTSSQINEESVNNVRDYYEALSQFYKLFPSLVTRDLYIAGESFGSQSMIKLGSLIQTQNNEIILKHKKDRSDYDTINLKGFIFLRGIFDIRKQMNFADYWFQMGIIDTAQKSILEQEQYKMLEFIDSGKYKLAYHKLSDIILGSKEITPFNTHFENFTGSTEIVNNPEYENRTHINNMIIFLNRDDIQNALHTANVSFLEFSPDVKNILLSSATISSTELLMELLPDYKFLSINTQLDPLTPAVFMDGYWNSFNISQLKNYSTTKKEFLAINDEFVGHYKNVEKLWQVFVRHDVDKQLFWQHEIVYKFINDYL